MFPKAEIKPIFIRFSNGTILSGSKKNKNLKDHGTKFQAKLIEIKTLKRNPERPDSQAKWQLKFKSQAGIFMLAMEMSSRKSASFFNTLANVDNFSEDLKFNISLGEPFKAGVTPPTKIFIIRDWDDWSTFFRWKYSYLKTGKSAIKGVVYFPYPESVIDHNGDPVMNNDGFPLKRWNNVNKFIETKIVDMIRQKLEKDVPGQDALETMDDLPGTVSSTPSETEKLMKNNVNHKQLHGNSVLIPAPMPPPDINDGLPF